MMDEPECYRRRCKHLRIEQPDGTEATERVCCDAFPEGIPDDIFNGEDMHQTVRADQVGTVVYERQD